MPFRFKNCFFPVLLFFAAPVHAQDPLIDSLNNLLKNAKADTLRLRLLVDLSEQCEEKDIMTYARPAAALADSILANDPADQQKILRLKATAINNIGYLQMNLGDVGHALDNLHAALSIREQLHDSDAIANSLNNIASIYRSQNLRDKAFDYFFRALAILEKINDSVLLAGTCNNLGVLYMNTGNYRKALEFHQKSLKIQERLGNKGGIALALNNIGYSYMSLEDEGQALDYYMRAYKIRKAMNNSIGISGSLINLGYLFMKNHKTDLAGRYADSALVYAKKNGYPEALRNIYQLLADVDSAQGDLKNAYVHYRLYTSYRDSLQNENTRRAGLQNQMKYEFAKKEDAIKADQDKRDAIAASEKLRQQIIIGSVGACLLLVIVFALFILRSFLQKKKANEELSHQKQVIEEKQKEILDSIYYARRIQRSLLPNEKYIERKLERLK